MLGRGAVGVVYKARQLGMDRVVALKVLAAEGFHDLQRFQRECQTLSKLEHPSIVRVFAWGGTGDGGQYLAMEFLDGTPLDAVLAAKGVLSVEDVVAMATQLCDALTYAHGLGIVHRDIKPANIMVAKDGGVKLLDFGLAKFVGSDLRVTRTEAIVGSPVYMAPEQFMSKEVGPRSDLYGLACTLYEALCGRVAFAGETAFETFNAHSNGEYEPLPETVPDRVRAAVSKALQPDAERRFASAQEFADALTGVTPIATMAPRVVAPKKKATAKKREPFRVPAKAVKVAIPLLVAFGAFVVGAQWYLQYESLPSQAARAEQSRDYAKAVKLYTKLLESVSAEKGQESPEALEAAMDLARAQKANGDIHGVKETWRSKIFWSFERAIQKGKRAKLDIQIRDREIRAAESVLPPNSVEIPELIAQQAWEAGEVHKSVFAQQEARKAIDLFAQLKEPLHSDWLARCHWVLADIARQQHDLPTAQVEYAAAVKEYVELRRRDVTGSYVSEFDGGSNFSAPLRRVRERLAEVYMSQKEWRKALTVYDDMFSREFIERLSFGAQGFDRLHALARKCEKHLAEADK